MTAHTLRNSAMATGWIAETPITVRARLLGAIALYGNRCDVRKDIAIEAIIARRPAYWTTAGCNQSRAYDIPMALNLGVDMDEALADAYPARLGIAHQREAALDTLIPLDHKAASILSLTYSAVRGTWRDEPELLMRAVRRAT